MKNLFIVLFCFLILEACNSKDELLCPKLSVIDTEKTIELAYGQRLSYTISEAESFLRNFEIYNIGGGKLKIGTLQTDSLASITQVNPNVITHDISSSFVFQTESLSVGTHNFEVHIPSNDWQQPLFVFYIELIVDPAPKPNIEVYQNQNLIPSPNGIYVLENTLIGESYQIPFRIVNTGNEQLLITSISSSSSIFNTTQAEQNTLGSNEETIFTITFTPRELGNAETIIQISNSDHDKNPYQFKITANPLPKPKPEISVFLIENTIETELQNGFEFIEGGMLTVGFDVFFEFSIKNQGEALLQIDSIKTDRSNAVVFNVNKNTLQPNENASFRLRLVATQSQEEIITIRIYNNDDDENPFIFKIRIQTQEPVLRIRYLTLSTPEGLNGDAASDGGANRTLFLKEFEVIDPNHLVTPTTVLRVRAIASTGASDSYTARTDGTNGRRIYFENDFDNLFFRQSIRFGDVAEYIDFAVYLQLSNGQTSNIETYRVRRPDGAN